MPATNRVYRIAVIPGDGIGKEVIPEGVRVLEAAAKKFGFEDSDALFKALRPTLRWARDSGYKVETVQDLLERVRILEAPRVHVLEDRLLAQEELHQIGHMGIDRLVVGRTRADGVGDQAHAVRLERGGIRDSHFSVLRKICGRRRACGRWPAGARRCRGRQ